MRAAFPSLLGSGALVPAFIGSSRADMLVRSRLSTGSEASFSNVTAALGLQTCSVESAKG